MISSQTEKPASEPASLTIKVKASVFGMQSFLRLSGLVMTCTLVPLLMLTPGTAVSETVEVLKQRRPELFHPETGYRIDRHRAPIPDDIAPPAIAIDTKRAAELIDQGAIAIDVFGALQSRYDELDGTWLVSKPRKSLPGAVWLPETGRGVLDDRMKTYLRSNLQKLTGGVPDKPLVVFCVADCWMSWNAAQRITEFGYTQVYWFRHGTDGWLEEGRSLAVTTPVPVDVD